MADAEIRKTGGAKTARSEIVSVRLDPRLRYLAEIAARVQRRTLSSYIEYVVGESLKSVRLEVTPAGRPLSIHDAGQTLWVQDEALRLLALKANQPELLTFEENSVFRLARQSAEFVGAADEGAFFQANFALFTEAIASGLDFDEIKGRLVQHLTPERIDELIKELTMMKKLAAKPPATKKR